MKNDEFYKKLDALLLDKINELLKVKENEKEKENEQMYKVTIWRKVGLPLVIERVHITQLYVFLNKFIDDKEIFEIVIDKYN